MKANEVPDKIYRTTTYLDNDKGKTLWKEASVKGAENVEYTRTDAFIEKACEWLKENMSNYIIEHPFFPAGSSVTVEEDKMVEDFRKVMEE